MPRFNGLGPNGQGSMTGRGLGPCNKENKTTEIKDDNNNNDNNDMMAQRFFAGPRGMGRRSCGMGRGRGGRGFGTRGMGFRGNF